MYFNYLEIKCNDENILNQIKQILLDEDDYGRKFFTMKKLLPLAEEKNNNVYHTFEEGLFSDKSATQTKQDSNEYVLKHYDLTWCMTNYGISQEVISDYILEENGQLLILYHSMFSASLSWYKVLADYFKSFITLNGNQKISFDHKYYCMEDCLSSHYFWNESGGKMGSSYYGLYDFASKHHAGLMNYLKVQDGQYKSEKDKILKQAGIEKDNPNDNQEKNNSMKNNL